MGRIDRINLHFGRVFRINYNFYILFRYILLIKQLTFQLLFTFIKNLKAR